MKTLTEKQKRFANEYLKDLNALQAYMRAGYTAKNPNVAGASSNRLLKNANVQHYIKEQQEKLQKESEITQAWVLKNLVEMFEKNKDCLLPGSAAAANKALELIGKHIGMFTDKLVHSGKIQEEITIEECDTKIQEILAKYTKDKKE
jgi:phage terminase small subunit